MKPTISLRWKILAWLFLNLAIIGILVFFFLRAQFRVGIDSLLAGATGDKLESIAQQIISELRGVPETEWNSILKQATSNWRKRGVNTALIRNNGKIVAGNIDRIPVEVQKLLEAYSRKRRGSMPPMRSPFISPNSDWHSPNPPVPWDRITSLSELGPPFSPGWGNLGNFRRPPPNNPPPNENVPVPNLEKFMVVGSERHLYWAGVHLDSNSNNSRLPVTLLFASDSIRGGGLFFDYMPWLWLGAGLVALSVFLWLPFVHSLTNSLRQLTQNAEIIAQGQFDPPPKISRRDEIGRLNRAHQHMATRLAGLIEGQKRFLGDTAHELLSPLARLELAISILEQRTTENTRTYTDRALNEVHHISTLVHDLLSFTKAGLRGPNPDFQIIRLKILTEEVIEREAGGKPIKVDIAPKLEALADRDLLMRALANAVRNAIRYAGDSGPIQIAAAPARDVENTVLLTISDRGPGVSPDELDKLFDPFYRPDTARTRESGGSGLGLAIVKSCVEACDGKVTARNLKPAGFEVALYLQSPHG